MKHYLSLILLLSVLSGRIPVWSQISRDTTLTIYFREDSWQPDGMELKRIDSFLTHHQGARIRRIEGHTDTIGSARYNLNLSRQRSGAIVHYLKTHWGSPGADQGYPVLNYGEERPADVHDNALNRRVGISLELREERKSADSMGDERAAMRIRDQEKIGPGTRVVENPDDSIVIEEGAIGDSVKEGEVLKKYRLDKLYFKPDIAVLENFSLSYIHSMALILKKYKTEAFEIRGHVNCPLSVKPGSGFMAKMNQLSVDRAKLVYGLLIGEGIPAERMSYKGMGNTEMVYPHARTGEEMRKNMRVEIFVIQTSTAQPSPQ